MTVPMTRASTVAQTLSRRVTSTPWRIRPGTQRPLCVQAQQVLGDGLPVPVVLGLDAAW
jgi:hypothetical protein